LALFVDTSIPHGNACDIEILHRAGETEVRFSADPHGGLEALWFCFRLTIESTDPQSVTLVLRNPQNLLGYLPATNIRPVINADGAGWKRLDAGCVRALPDGRIQIAWNLQLRSSYADVAFCYPYGLPEIEQLVNDTDGYWRADTIGVSQGARPIVRLSNRYGEPGSADPGLYIVARQHAGETSGSWVLDGFLRHMATAAGAAPMVWVVPLINIDGVERGDYGKDNWPHDLNRAWHTPPRSPMRYEVLVAQHDIALWSKRCRPTLAMDWHAPGGTEAEGIYFPLPDPEKETQGYLHAFRWAEELQRALGSRYARPGLPRHSSYPSRWEEPWGRPGFSSYMWNHLQVPAVSIEVPYAMIGDLVMTRDEYRSAGRQLAQGVLERLGNRDHR